MLHRHASQRSAIPSHLPAWRALFYLLCFAISSCHCLNSEGQLLLRFKALILVDPLGLLNNWNAADADPHWSGIVCNNVSTAVITLSLPRAQLQGSLPPEIGALAHLRDLNLHHNHLFGPIPTAPKPLPLLKSGSGGLSKGAIVGDAAGVALVCLVFLYLYCYWRAFSQKKKSSLKKASLHHGAALLHRRRDRGPGQQRGARPGQQSSYRSARFREQPRDQRKGGGSFISDAGSRGCSIRGITVLHSTRVAEGERS